VLDGDDVVYLALAPSFRAADIKINIGSRRTAWTTSPGRVLLAGLPDDELEKRLSEHLDLGDELKQIRVRGWALVDDDEGLRAVAVPVRNRRGTVVAAITLSTQATPDVIALEHVPEVLRTARTIEADLAAHPERAD
jgi:IclR family pca regulon transcriptional regulator